ncbi:pyridoxamine 5'-phosphate oxidase family protein [Priestia flexa]|uniref:pyridoxamine 5'-phosphate oxidase family protein n=1 Tax=Priestia flexa TaxID=86664 RepID=UPI00240D8019|nr:pyridoxamine 5'-phosphate oxidase family protein [Priestia flexa]WEZ07344.1 pyridoxamine 5'-phosphate oxidase family protein [Priestia flexa]
MNKQEMMDKLSNLLDENRVGTLATVVNQKPNSRYMTFFKKDGDITLYTPTSIATHKGDEIDENGNVHILLGYSGEGYGDNYVEVSGIAKINDNQELKNRFWNDHMSQWFNGPDDTNYVLLEITPTHIKLMNEGKDTPTSISL